MVLNAARGASVNEQSNRKIKVAGYVKLAKLWERSKDKAIAYHTEYYNNKYDGSPQFQLVGVYIDITGKKEIRQRSEMLHLLRDCSLGQVECIDAQTSGYLAANAKEFNYLIRMLFDMGSGINIMTENNSFKIDTLRNVDNQREALSQMVNELIALAPEEYSRWHSRVVNGMNSIVSE